MMSGARDKCEDRSRGSVRLTDEGGQADEKESGTGSDPRRFMNRIVSFLFGDPDLAQRVSIFESDFLKPIVAPR